MRVLYALLLLRLLGNQQCIPLRFSSLQVILFLLLTESFDFPLLQVGQREEPCVHNFHRVSRLRSLQVEFNGPIIPIPYRRLIMTCTALRRVQVKRELLRDGASSTILTYLICRRELPLDETPLEDLANPWLYSRTQRQLTTFDYISVLWLHLEIYSAPLLLR